MPLCQKATGNEGAGLVRHLTSDLRKYVVGVAADQPDRADHDDQDYSKHHRVLGDVLTALFSPKLMDISYHCLPPIGDAPKLTDSSSRHWFAVS